MKYVTMLSLAVITIIILVFGQTQWSNKIEQTVTSENEKQPSSEAKKEKKNSSLFEDVTDTKLKSTLEEAVSKHGKARILIAGSKALGSQESGLGKTLSQELEESFEPDVAVSFIDYDGTSTQLIEDDLISDYQNVQPDVLILDGFTLADNGNVEVQDNHANISTIIEGLKSVNEDLYVILMPTHPIPKATIYPKQADALKEYASENNITYIDHWQAWPDYKNEAELMKYLKEDKSAPNKQGIEIWANEVLKLFGI